MTVEIHAELNRLSGRVVAVKAMLLREALAGKGLRGLDRFDLKALVKALGVRGAAFRVRYFNNLMRESTTPGLFEWLLAVWARHHAVARYRKRGWLVR